MSDIFKKKYMLAEPGCGLTVFSMEGGEINLFGSCTLIKTSAEDIYEPIKDFLQEKLVEEKSDTMYYIGVAGTVVLGVLAGVALLAGVAATGASCGAGAPLLGVGAALAGAAVSLYAYTFNTLAPDRDSENSRSWLQFYLEANIKSVRGRVRGH